ncbi:hypothetical protein P4O66_017046, partial [Electrophorus voltai]
MMHLRKHFPLSMLLLDPESFVMGLRVLLGFLGLQLCLFCSAHGTDARSRTTLQRFRPDRGSETQHMPLLQAEVPLLGLGQKYLAPQDVHLILMEHKTRKRRQAEKKKKKKLNPGAYSVLTVSLSSPDPPEKEMPA